MYEEEEEGYGSGGDMLDDDIIRIRVKVCLSIMFFGSLISLLTLWRD